MMDQLQWQAIDLVFNVSGMWHDIQTLTDDNANWWMKAAAVADLGVTIFTDINMLDCEGEAARAAEIGAEVAEKGVADVLETVGRDTTRVVEACGGGLSFQFTTKVATQQGEQAIGTLNVGTKVWAYNPSTKTMELKPILHVWVNHDNDLVDLTITKTPQGKGTTPSSEVLHTNKKHPFLTVEKGFVPVGQIKLGMHVVEADGQVGVISRWKVVSGVKVMYNLEVAQDHTYPVGAGQWVVHNCGSVNEVIKALQKGGYNLGNPPHFVESLTERYGKELGNITAEKIASVLQDGYHYFRTGDQAGSGALKFTATLDNTSIVYNSETKELVTIFRRGVPSGVTSAFQAVKNWSNPFRELEDFR